MFELIIAHRGINANGHQYSEECLRMMAESLPGKPIMRSEPDPEAPGGDVNNLIGVVESASFRDGSVYCVPRFFNREVAAGFLTPTGTGKKEGDTITQYTPDHLTFASESAFSMATRIGDKGV